MAQQQAMQFHEAASIFPLMEGPEFDALVESIRAHGLKESIKLHQGKIIDGRNRQTACLLAGVKPRYEEASVDGSAADYVFQLNYHRRHLTDGGRQLAAGRYKEVAAKEARERQQATLKRGNATPVQANLPERGIKGQSRDAAGAKFDVSGKTVDFAERVLKNGSPKLIKAVESGDVKVSTASRLAQAPKAVQEEAIKGGKSAIRAAIEQHVPSPSEEARNDPGVKWHKSTREILSRIVSTRELGGIEVLTASWTPELIEQYRDDVVELIKELEVWKKALTAKLKKS